MPRVNDLPESLQVYDYHGLDVSAVPVGGQVYTDCPWCGREKKFSINVRTGQWKCWVCAEGTDNGGGNATTFVRVLWAKSDAATNGASTVLAQARRLLDPMTLTRWGVAQSIITKEWLVPGYNAEGKLCTLYKYVGRPKKLLYPTPTLHHQLFGTAESFDGKKQTVHFFESLWNALAFWEVARQTRQESGTLTPTANEAKSLLADANVLAGAGCGSIGEPFAKFTSLFAGKDVVLWFDSDHPRQRPDGTTVEGAGWLATQRAVDILQRSSEPPRSIRYLKWGDRGHDPSQKSGYDVRDVLSTGENVSSRVSLLGGLLGKVAPVPKEWTSRETKIRQASKDSHEKRDIEVLSCSSWRELLVALRRFFRSRQSVEDVLACMMAVAASTSRVGDQLFLQVIGDAGCLHRDTSIYDPVDGTSKTVEVRCLEGKQFNVYSKMHDGTVGICRALPPKSYTEEDMYEVTFRSGRSLKVTGKHRFWNGKEYVTAACVSGLLVSGPYPLPSISEHDLSARVSGVPRLRQTTQGSPVSCSACSCLGDGQPQSAEGSVPDGPPSPVDALGHIRPSSHVDGSEQGRVHNHPGPESCHPARLDCSHPESIQQTTSVLHHSPEGTSAQCQSYIRGGDNTLQPIPQSGTVPRSQAASPSTLPSDEILQDRPSEESGTLCPCRHLQTEPRQQWTDPPGTGQRWPEGSRGGLGEALENSTEVMGDHPYTVTQFDEIISVTYAGRDVYYDFHVPGTENYWAEGVFNHNSGKTQLCDGMLVSKHCYALESLTGFHSGFRGTGSDSGKDHSILANHNHQTWITPEADVMVSSPDYGKLMGQARRIFDGKSSKKYGNQIEAMDYQGLRTPWIQAGTPAMLDHGQASVGDRFLKVMIDRPGSDDRADIMRRVGHTALRASLAESNGVPESRHEEHTLTFYRTAGGYVDFLRENVGRALQDLDLTNADEVVDQCASMAELTAFLRARPYEDKQHKEMHNTVELPTRLQAQLVRMSACLSVVLNKGAIDDEVLRVVRKVALNTANGTTLEMVRNIYTVDSEGLEADELAAMVGKPPELVRKLLSFMRGIGAMEHWTPKGVGKTARRRWRPTAALAEAWGRVHNLESNNV